MIRIAEPRVITSKIKANKRSKPTFLATLGANDEQRANMSRGIVVTIPSELTDTFKSAAMVDKTVRIVVKGIRKIKPITTIPKPTNQEGCFFIDFS